MIRDRSNNDRGTGRIEAFSDGVIAVAITLLILNVQVPNVQIGLLQALLKQWPSYLGYVTSFLVITIFLANHHNMFRHIHQVDYALLLINSLFLMCIAFIPFVTSLLTQYITSPTEQHTAAIVYGATLLFSALTALILLAWVRSQRPKVIYHTPMLKMNCQRWIVNPNSLPGSTISSHGRTTRKHYAARYAV